MLWKCCPHYVSKSGKLSNGHRTEKDEFSFQSQRKAMPKNVQTMAQFSLVQSFSHVQLFVTPWTAACQASLSITSSQSLPKIMSIESVRPSNHLILCHLLLLLPSVFPNLRVFSYESAFHLFQSCGHSWVLQIHWHIECSTFTASSFRIWNSSTGIPWPALALFIVMFPKAHLTSHFRMSGSRWVITPSWLSVV